MRETKFARGVVAACLAMDVRRDVLADKCHCGKKAIAWYEYVSKYEADFCPEIVSVCEAHNDYHQSTWRLLTPEEVTIKIVMDE